jgi:hypothetical protein
MKNEKKKISQKLKINFSNKNIKNKKKKIIQKTKKY